MKRKICPSCDKAIKACICQSIKKIDSDIQIIILQHPSEVKNAIGTARILNLSLPNCHIIVGENFTENDELNRYLNDPDRNCYLLYPSEDSVNIAEFELTTTQHQNTYILLDGTWRKAFKMYQSSTNLHDLQAIRYDSSLVSNYTIRSTSVAGGLSTVEAGHLLLSTLDNNKQKYQPLLDSFEYMINFQIAAMPEGVFKKHYLQSNKDN